MTYCKGYLEKQRKIDELEEENALLKAKLRYQQRSAKEGLLGSSTPSSKPPHKPNSSPDKPNCGGGKPGHKGHGRSSVCEQDADEVQTVEVGDVCPDYRTARLQSQDGDRLSAGQDQEGSLPSGAKTLPRMQTDCHSRAAGCSCQMPLFKSASGLCGGSALHLRQYFRSD